MTKAPKKLHPFQEIGADFVAARKHAYLADEMGLGKTPQLCAALDRAGARRALIVCPAILEDDWEDTLADFTPNRSPPHRLRDPREIPAAGDVIVSYDRAVIHADALRAMRWDAMICDEAHFLKNPGAARTRAILNPIYGGRRSLAASSGAVWLASGSPIPNHVGELWPALRTAGIDNGRYWDFVYRYCQVEERRIGRVTQRKPRKTKDPAAVTALLKGYMLRRTAAEVLPELPPLTERVVEVPGAEIDASDPILPVLRQLDADAHDAISAAINMGDWAMAHVPHIATIRRLTGLAKAATAAAIARLELECVHDKVVLFGLHTDVLQYLRHELRDFNPVMLTGAESHTKRRNAIKSFQNDPSARVAIGQSRAAGAGITLTASCRLISVESAWTRAENAQVIKRVHRIGQHRPTTATTLVLQGSSDARVAEANAVKSQVASDILTTELTL